MGLGVPTTEKTENSGGESGGEEGFNLVEEVVLDEKEHVVMDNDVCKISIVCIKINMFNELQLDAIYKNKTADREIEIYLQDESVNGLQTDAMGYAAVRAGEEISADIRFDLALLGEYGITKATDIAVTFEVLDAEEIGKKLAKESIRLYPYGEDKAEKYVRQSKPTDKVVIDNEYISIIVSSYGHDDTWGHYVDFYILNKTDKKISVFTNSVLVNGADLDPFFSVDLLPGQSAYEMMYWFDNEFEHAGIEKIEKLEFGLIAAKYEDTEDRVLVNEEHMEIDFK